MFTRCAYVRTRPPFATPEALGYAPGFASTDAIRSCLACRSLSNQLAVDVDVVEDCETDEVRAGILALIENDGDRPDRGANRCRRRNDAPNYRIPAKAQPVSARRRQHSRRCCRRIAPDEMGHAVGSHDVEARRARAAVRTR